MMTGLRAGITQSPNPPLHLRTLHQVLSTAVSIDCSSHNGANSRTAFKILWFIFWFRIRILLNLLCDLRSEFLLHTKFVDSGQNPPFYDSAHIEIFVNLLYPHQALGVK